MSKARHRGGHHAAPAHKGTHHGPAHAGLSHHEGVGHKPMEHPHPGHPMHHKRARGGGIGDDEKMPKEEVYEGAGSRTLKEAERRKHGGKAPMHVGGHAPKHHRLDRRGRKRGGSVGADSHPLTEASRLTAPEGEGKGYRLDREDD